MLDKWTQRSIDVLSVLEGFEFAVTGSYARKVLSNGSSLFDFDRDSDLDIAVHYSDLEAAYERLKSSEHFLMGHKWLSYGPRVPQPYPLPKPHPPKSKGYILEIDGGLPIHLVNTLIPEQREDFVNRENLGYLFPIAFSEN